MRKALVAAAVVATMLGSARYAGAATITSDIILIVDESGSMGDVQANLRNNIGAFATILAAGGIDARFGLVGYGNSAIMPRLLSDLTTAGNFAIAAQGLQVTGGTEPGYSAIAFALNGIDGQTSTISFRPNALKNLIIFTDEPSNGDNCSGCLTGGNSTTLADAQALLTSNNTLFNAVLRIQNTIASYQPLVDAHGGHVYDLNGLNTTNQAVVQQFVTQFANSKLQETLDFCALNPTDPACQGLPEVPEPGTLVLLGTGIGAVCLLRQRRKASRPRA